MKGASTAARLIGGLALSGWAIGAPTRGSLVVPVDLLASDFTWAAAPSHRLMACTVELGGDGFVENKSSEPNSCTFQQWFTVPNPANATFVASLLPSEGADARLECGILGPGPGGDLTRFTHNITGAPEEWHQLTKDVELKREGEYAMACSVVSRPGTDVAVHKFNLLVYPEQHQEKAISPEKRHAHPPEDENDIPPPRPNNNPPVQKSSMIFTRSATASAGGTISIAYIPNTSGIPSQYWHKPGWTTDSGSSSNIHTFTSTSTASPEPTDRNKEMTSKTPSTTSADQDQADESGSSDIDPSTAAASSRKGTERANKQYFSKGCVVSTVGGRRIFPDETLKSDEMTPQICAHHCYDYPFFGLEYGSECWCGEKLASAVLVPDHECNIDCSGDHSSRCGGNNRVSVFQHGITHETVTAEEPESPEEPDIAGDFVGCFTETAEQGSKRLLAATKEYDTNMTLEMCEDFCASEGMARGANGTAPAYRYWGVEYGTECYCADVMTAGSTTVPETSCRLACGGNKNHYCGGANRVRVFESTQGAEEMSKEEAEIRAEEEYNKQKSHN